MYQTNCDRRISKSIFDFLDPMFPGLLASGIQYMECLCQKNTLAKWTMPPIKGSDPLVDKSPTLHKKYL